MATSQDGQARLDPESPRLVVPARPGLPGPVHPGPVVLVGALLLAPRFLNEYWTFNVIVGLTLGIACLGVHVLVSWARRISLMHAGVVGSAVYLSTYTTHHLFEPRYSQAGREAALAAGQTGPGRFMEPDLDVDPFVLAGAAVGIGFAIVLYATVGLVAQRVAGIYVVTLTFAVQFGLEAAVFARQDLTGSHARAPRPTPFGISLQSDARYYYLVAIVLLTLLWVLYRIRESRLGRAIVSAGHDPETAAVSGISPWRYRLVAFVLAGLCAGLSGALQSPLYRSPPGELQYTMFNSVLYLAVALIAGGASLIAVVVVAVSLQLLPELVLCGQLNIYLLGGVGMVAGILLGRVAWVAW